ncbi:metallophosphoesterase [Epilithonimonas hispanica]|uniref:Phosphoesterase n=1 Tax=Epilithonimonas hispanica TaxID=358687 RepID=A0A3D9CPS6_9FLAO|nr:metallophosphoesterase [Epilithonimonas hispanica]REC67764.1 phosphoesterase [Epilithonimonas hispanica]
MTRKSFIKKSLLATGGLSLLYSWQIEPFWLEFVKQDLPIKNLPSKLHNKVLMQISDLHVGNRFDYNYLIDSFKKAKAYKPDIVVYTGDFVCWEDNPEQFEQLKIVMKEAVLGTLGTVAILGNHDYGAKWREEYVADEISSIINDSKIQMLRDEKADISGLNIYGFEELWGTNFHPENLTKVINSDDANLVLCHNPDVCDLDVWNNYKGWILSGHTHGGQAKPPFLPPLILPVKNRKYTSGIIDLEDGRMLYINRALGHSYQVRFNCRPEITLFTLKSI